MTTVMRSKTQTKGEGSVEMNGEGLYSSDTHEVRRALKQGADPNARDEQLGRPLFHQVVNQQHHLVSLLLEFGADPHRDGVALWLEAAANEDEMMLALLSGSGLDPDCSEGDGKTALHYAATMGLSQAIGPLVKLGPKVNARDQEGITPLQRSIEGDHFDCATELLVAGARANTTDPEGTLMLHLAYEVHADLATLLLEYGSYPVKAPDGIPILRYVPDPSWLEHCPFIHAILDGNLTSALTLCASQTARGEKGPAGLTPLTAAIASGNNTVATWLITSGFPLDQRDDEGNTPLHVAALCRNDQITSTLLESGADPHVENAYGWTPTIIKLSYTHPHLVSRE
jgi:ankyrin repeat protein